jgi:hypothetical protein
MLVISMDVGILHMAFLAVLLKRPYKLYSYDRLLAKELIDITKFECEENCPLHHERCLADQLAHLFHRKRMLFARAKVILVEQQPPLGLIGVQELIRYRFRNKVIMVAPRSVHTWFRTTKLTYEERKIWSVKFALRFLRDKFGDVEGIPYERQHDIGDACVQLHYYLSQLNEKVASVKVSKYFPLR